MIEPEILTIDPLARYLKVPKSTLYRLVREGKVPSHKVGRHWRFRRDSINRWFDQPQGQSLEPLRNAAP